MTQFIAIVAIVLAIIGLLGLNLFLFGRLTARDRVALVEKYQTITVDSRERKYRYYSPSPDKQLPLVVMLHGYNYDSSRISELYSGWSNLAAETGEFAVVYPQGIKRSWNGDFCCGYSKQNNIDDVGFIMAMLDELEANNQIDSGQIYLAGFSNGSFLAQKLLNELPNRFAAGALVMTGVGEKDGRRANISSVTAPLLIVNGANDPYTNHSLPKPGFKFTTHQQTVDAWSSQLESTSSNQQTTNEYEQQTFKTGDQTVLVSRVYNTSHRWPQWRLWMFKNEVSPFTRDAWQQLHQLGIQK